MSTYSTYVSYFNSTFGSSCTAGNYCPTGSTLPLTCDAGYYCPSILMSVRGPACQAGYYCAGGANTSTPIDGTTGNICPGGSYCPAGSLDPSPCPLGTFLNSTGASDSSNCTDCPPGMYCGTLGAAYPTGSCSAGYYCPGAVQTAQPINYICPLGYYCPAGTQQPHKCAKGYYSFVTGSTSCTACPIGYYCSANNAATPCDPGYYCPGGDVEVPCPSGTYSTAYGATSSSTCIACTAGYACTTPGVASPVLQCTGGYYC